MSFNTVERTMVVPVTNMQFTTGTWTISSSSGVLQAAKSAADETPKVSIPIALDRRSEQFGSKLKAIRLHYRATTTNLEAAPAVSLVRVNLKALSDASLDTDTTAVSTTHDGVVTANAKDRLLTITVSSPDFDLSSQARAYYNLDVDFNCAAGTVLTIKGAEVVYDELT